MAEHYYYSQGDNQFGPFSATELRKLAADGRIQPTDSVWREGSGQRVQAARVKNLFATPPPPPSPPGTSAAHSEAPPQEPAQAPPTAPAGEAPADPAPQGGAAEERPGDAAESSSPESAVPGQPPGGVTSSSSARHVLEASQRRPEPPARPKRVVGIKGAVLTGQDGVKAQFRKKCEKCGWEDSARSSTIIRPGSSRVPFFCPKCRRGRAVEITAVF
jgi:hypothetical protein